MLISGYRPGQCDALAAMSERATARDLTGLRPRKLLPGDVVGDAEILAVLDRDLAKPAHERVRAKCRMCGVASNRYAHNVWANSGRCPSRIVGRGRKLTCRPDRP